MAKQTFTTGQVLTAAQVNALNSNDFNQTVSVKTAAYTLVAADKGTRIEFNTSGSVTCTVNTGLFDAGDTLVIQNRGAGAVTVTAGTATVNTSATLVLSQYDAGTLYFISASAAIFFNTDAGGGSPLTTKGDIFVFGTADSRLPIGTNNHVLTADSSESLGMKWAALASAGKVKQVVQATSTTATTVASTTFADTGLSATITPTANDSKILVIIDQSVDASRSSTQTGSGIKLLRGATVVYNIGDLSGAANNAIALSITGATAVGILCRVGGVYLDSPATTSSTTYKTQGASWLTSNSGTTTFQSGGSISSLTLIEIGA